ncbi:hypothetical protein HG530_014234 [Fusarium avenaceum]|nr:hypothetical protein HG530_014234 [Fusarium avenaceum]
MSSMILQICAYLCGLAGRGHNSLLQLVALNNTELPHISDTTTRGGQIQAVCCEAIVEGLSQPSNEISRVETSVISQDMTELDLFGMVKCGSDLTASDKGQTLNAIEIGVLNRHDTSISEQLLGPVINELSVDKAVDAVRLDLLHLGLHLLLLGLLELGQLACRANLDTCTKDLDLSLGLVDTNLLVENETLIEVRVTKLASSLLDDLDMVEVGRFETENGIDGKFGELSTVLGKNLGAECCSGNGEQILSEGLGVLAVVDG